MGDVIVKSAPLFLRNSISIEEKEPLQKIVFSEE